LVDRHDFRLADLSAIFLAHDTKIDQINDFAELLRVLVDKSVNPDRINDHAEGLYEEADYGAVSGNSKAGEAVQAAAPPKRGRYGASVRERMSREALQLLAATETTTDLPTACRALSIGTNLGYELLARGEFPVRVLRLGRLIRIPTAELLAILGVSQEFERRQAVRSMKAPSAPLAELPAVAPDS
jgi:hypothetical protein